MKLPKIDPENVSTWVILSAYSVLFILLAGLGNVMFSKRLKVGSCVQTRNGYIAKIIEVGVRSYKIRYIHQNNIYRDSVLFFDDEKMIELVDCWETK